jgi:phosphate transport system protein
MTRSHILQDFDFGISQIREEVLTMAGKARHNLERAMQSLMERNTDMANAVIADDAEVDELERRIDVLGMEVLVRFHPLASDLRLVISSMKIATSLERISDHATSIAKRARKIIQSAEIPEATLIEPIYTLADQLLQDAIKAYSERDSQLGAGLHQRDKELDRMHKEAMAKIGERIEEQASRYDDYVNLIFVVRSLERVGDLSVNIGEDAVFMGEARDIRYGADREVEKS